MQRYEPPIPRAALGSIAIVMAAITLASFVVLPMKLESVSTTTCDRIAIESRILAKEKS
jgi:hypothetical protein